MSFPYLGRAGMFLAAYLLQIKRNDMQSPNLLLTEKLNHLCAILEDAHAGYQMAAEYTRSEDLEITFDRLSYERLHFVREIKKQMSDAGLTITTGDGFLNLLHRNWQEMRFKIKSGNTDTIQCCCVIGEKATINYYESVINDLDIPAGLQNLLSSQLQTICDTVKSFTPEAVPAETKVLNLSSAAAAIAKTSRNKIVFIISFLKRVASDFEMIADEIEDKNLKNAFISLSEEDNQFAEELNNQLKNFGVTVAADENMLQWDETELLFTSIENSKSKELIHICDKSEYMFLKLYTEALKEHLSFNKLRDTMVYQYNSIRAGFVKLRMLHSLRMNEQLGLS